jgi:DNA-binding MarR family transcriptional regulator
MVIKTERNVGDIYDPKTIQPSSSIGYLINRVRTEFIEAIDRELAPLDVTAAQYIIMGHLAHNLADSASQLCKGISYDPGAMTRMIDRLEAKGFIRRVRSSEDRRAVNLELTDEGKAVFPKLRVSVVGVLNRFLRGFTKSEARQLENLLQRILANI